MVIALTQVENLGSLLHGWLSPPDMMSVGHEKCARCWREALGAANGGGQKLSRHGRAMAAPWPPHGHPRAQGRSSESPSLPTSIAVIQGRLGASWGSCDKN